jgi:zinc protease
MLGRFHDLGAQIESGVAENNMSFAFSVMKEGSDEVLDMLKDAIIAPEFQQERLDYAKARMRNAVAHRNDEGPEILRREFLRALFGKNSPYSAQVEYASIDRINRGDLVDFHQRYFFPKNVMLSVEGDFDAAKMKARLEALFTDWKNEQPPVPEFPKANSAGAAGKFLAVSKDPTHAYFVVGQLGAGDPEKDYPALQIAADILGKAPQGRLVRKLGVNGDVLTARWSASLGHPGTFTISGTINPFKTARVLQAVYQELTAIRTTEVSEEELRTAKDTVFNSMVFDYGNHLTMMPRLLEFEYYGLPKDYTEQYQKALAGVTRADVLRVAKEYLDPARMSTVVLANPTTFEVPLDSLGGVVTSIDLTIPPPKVEAAVLGDPVTERRGKELLARAQQAMGGSEKMAAVSDYVSESQYVDAAGVQKATMTERWLSPGYLRQDNVLDAGSLSVFCDGKTGWVGSARNSSALTGMQLKQVQSDLFRVLFPLLLSDRVPGRKVNALDANTVEISDASGQLAKLVFDPATGLLKNTLYDTVTANGQVSVIDTYSEYRDAAGLKVPFKVAIAVNGDKFQEVTVKSIQLNTGLKLQDLEKRP